MDASLPRLPGQGRGRLTPPSPFVGEGTPPQTYAELLLLARRSVKKRLTALLTRARRQGIRAQAVFVEGLPADEILRPRGALAPISW